MLAPNEGTALVADGTISEIERKALIELRDKLRSGEIVSYKDSLAGGLTAGPGPHLEMSVWYEPSVCGTVGCIAGLCYHLSGRKAFPEVNTVDTYPSRRWSKRSDDLLQLFLPSGARYRDATETEHAITSFLTFGKADWGESRRQRVQEFAIATALLVERNAQ